MKKNLSLNIKDLIVGVLAVILLVIFHTQEARAVLITFDAGSGLPASYSESGMTVTPTSGFLPF